MVDAPLVHVSLTLAPEMQQRYTAELAKRGYEARFLRGIELQKRLGECRFLLTGRPPRLDWSRATELRLIQVAGTGVDPLFPAVGLSSQTWIANLRGPHEDSVRDHVLSLMLAHARRLPHALENQRQHHWVPYSSKPLSGQTLLLVGFGGIGRRVGRAAKALGMRVVAVRRSGASSPEVDAILGPDELANGLSNADYVVVCLPLTSKTRGMVSPPMIASLPKHAALIDVSRGGIVDHVALEAALRSGNLAGAALDVFDEEPLPVSSTLWSCPNLIITPHVGGWTETYLDQALEVFVDNVERIRRGEPPVSQVSREHEY